MAARVPSLTLLSNVSFTLNLKKFASGGHGSKDPMASNSCLH